MASRELKGGSFGAPRPLPGQAGFTRQKESTLLETETTQMADRLQALRDQMTREKELREASTTQKVGGTKWKSARTDRSVRNYAKEVKDKYQQKVDNARAIPQGRRSSNEKSVVSTQIILGTGGGGGGGGDGGNVSKIDKNSQLNSVTSWSMDEVVAWLESLELSSTYNDVFIQNEITGPILLDIGLDDLDYMEIRKLAHRKLILKGIQDLKKNGKPTLNFLQHQQQNNVGFSPDQPTLQHTSNHSQEVDISLPRPPVASLNTVVVGGEVKPSANKIHWSQAKPLSENIVHNDQAGFTNLADGVYDEAAQAREFQAAVAAWRNGGKTDGATSTSSGKDDIIEKKATPGGIAEFGFGPESESPRSKNEWKNPWAASSNSNAEKRVINHQPPSLLDGVYDEEAQAREFQAAVAAWRTGGSATPRSDVIKIEGGGVTGGSGMSRLRGAEEVAEALGKQLDETRNLEAKHLAQQRQEVELKLQEQKAELEARRARLVEAAKNNERLDQQKDITGDWESDNGDDDDIGIKRIGENFEGQLEQQDAPLYEPLSARSDISCDVIETTLGYTPRRNDNGGQGFDHDDDGCSEYVVVEEADSDDE